MEKTFYVDYYGANKVFQGTAISAMTVTGAKRIASTTAPEGCTFITMQTAWIRYEYWKKRWTTHDANS